MAHSQTQEHGGRAGFIYRHVLKGYSAALPTSAVEALRRDPRVRYVTPDQRFEALSQVTPTGIERTGALDNPALDIDGQDDLRVDADIAVLDTGVDTSHPELSVVERTNCLEAEEGTECADGQGSDANGHGTHVAGTAAAIDNHEGVVGIAPGARLWSVKVLNSSGSGTEAGIVAGVEWVADHADQIEVANMSLGCMCSSPALEDAISGYEEEGSEYPGAADEGVVFTVAAGNAGAQGVASPASNPDVIAVSALADYDGRPGGTGAHTCADGGDDDTLFALSNWGSSVDVAAPGVCINSTVPGGGYAEFSGTSMAAPHVAGAAALLASESSPESLEDVEDIRQAIVDTGSQCWEQAFPASAGDTQEPLLSLRPPAGTEACAARGSAVPNIESTPPGSAVLHGSVNPGSTETTYQFEYGTTTQYGKAVPASPASVGSGAKDIKISEEIDDLEPATTYHFRVAATNASGTTYSDDAVFRSSGLFDGAVEHPDFDVPCNALVEDCIVEGITGQYEIDSGLGYAWQCEHIFDLTFDASGKVYASNYVTQGEICHMWPCDTEGASVWPGVIERYDGGRARAIVEVCFEEHLGQKYYDVLELYLYPAKAEIVAGVQKFHNTKMAGQWISPGSMENAAHISAVPTVSTEPAVHIDGDRATVKGSVTPNGADTSYHFEYGTDTSYGTSIPAGGAAAGAGTSASQVMEEITGLLPDTTYHYRVVASNSHGTVYGKDETFTTRNWSLQATPNPEGSTNSGFRDVSCPATDTCVAIGYNESAGTSFVEEWDGASWRIALTTPAHLEAISCWAAVSAKCRVVGHSEGQHAIWGVNLTLGFLALEEVPSPEGGSNISLKDVSCTAASACTAVGSYYASGYQPLAIRWDGSSWTVQSTPAPSGEEGNGGELLAVSCPSVSACTATGLKRTPSSGWASFAERWNGSSWSIVETADPSGAEGEAMLDDVSCSSASSCLATGYTDDGQEPMVQSWNGTAWSLETIPTPAGAQGAVRLNGVSCASAGSCILAGGYVSEVDEKWGLQFPSQEKTLALSWDGKSFGINSTPNREGHEFNLLRAISCSSVAACTAVGDSRPESAEAGRETLGVRYE
ncbi:MAG: S8 family serine peptidase [Solirubrobacterales bacterium]